MQSLAQHNKGVLVVDVDERPLSVLLNLSVGDEHAQHRSGWHPYQSNMTNFDDGLERLKRRCIPARSTRDVGMPCPRREPPSCPSPPSLVGALMPRLELWVASQVFVRLKQEQKVNA